MENKDLIEKLAKWLGWHTYDSIPSIYVSADGEMTRSKKAWNPTENIADAWELVEKLKEDWLILIENQPEGYWWIGLVNKIDFELVKIEVKSETAPMAICKAVEKVMDGNS